VTAITATTATAMATARARARSRRTDAAGRESCLAGVRPLGPRMVSNVVL
jgi:hypothetical protein